MARTKAAPAALLPVRVLLDCSYGRADTVVELPAEIARAAAAAGEVDPHPDAVAYALARLTDNRREP